MEFGGTVYIMTNIHHTVLYTGVTSDLIGRVQQHKTNYYPNSFTARYNVHTLVYYAFYPAIEEAIAVEKQIKAGSRARKIALIQAMNPNWNDLWEEIKNW